ncbi:MAG: glucokinase [Deltaproteobacteria bacterium]|nr:glucokinase [Deltaproteobacteria bacterium]
MLIAGDIGGTKTILGIFSKEGGSRKPLREEHYSSNRYEGLEPMIHEFMSGLDVCLDGAVFGIAGPVRGGAFVEVTNLPWTVTADSLKKYLSIESVLLLNDVQAMAYSIPLLAGDDLRTIEEGDPHASGVTGVVAPGTGLGEAYLTERNDRYHVHASEGGHADFAPIDDIQIQLLQFAGKRFEHVSCERVCSGGGMRLLYEFLRDIGYAEEPRWFQQEMAETDDAGALIIRSALGESRPCFLCRATLKLFLSILGAEAGNFALKVFALGGIYLGGGIPPLIPDELYRECFLKTFTAKGRFTGLLRKIPVKVIMNRKAVLMGAAALGLEKL